MRKDDSQRKNGWAKHARNSELGKPKTNQAVRRKVKSDLMEGRYRNDSIDDIIVFDDTKDYDDTKIDFLSD
jgi:hypothetical protein